MNRAISLGVERALFSVESAGLYFWRMRTSFLVECLVRVLNRRVAVAKDASPWQKQALNKLDASSMETTRIREPQGPLVASSLGSERYSPVFLKSSTGWAPESKSQLLKNMRAIIGLTVHINFFREALLWWSQYSDIWCEGYEGESTSVCARVRGSERRESERESVS